MREYLAQLVVKLLDSYVTDDMVAQAKAAMLSYLRELAARTDTEIDDALVDMVERAMTVDPK